MQKSKKKLLLSINVGSWFCTLFSTPSISVERFICLMSFWIWCRKQKRPKDKKSKESQKARARANIDLGCVTGPWEAWIEALAQLDRLDNIVLNSGWMKSGWWKGNFRRWAVCLSTSEEYIIFVLFLKIFGNSLSFWKMVSWIWKVWKVYQLNLIIWNVEMWIGPSIGPWNSSLARALLKAIFGHHWC